MAGLTLRGRLCGTARLAGGVVFGGAAQRLLYRAWLRSGNLVDFAIREYVPQRRATALQEQRRGAFESEKELVRGEERLARTAWLEACPNTYTIPPDCPPRPRSNDGVHLGDEPPGVGSSHDLDELGYGGQPQPRDLEPQRGGLEPVCGRRLLSDGVCDDIADGGKPPPPQIGWKALPSVHHQLLAGLQRNLEHLSSTRQRQEASACR